MCNSYGVCCADPALHEGYILARQMAKAGNCCAHAIDCTSGICISGACWDPVDHQDIHQEHQMRAMLFTAGVVAFLVLGVCVAWHCMKSIKVEVKIKAKRNWQDHNKDNSDS